MVMARADGRLITELERWAWRYEHSGGEFDETALFAAGEEALKALRAGYGFEEAFRIGRDVYFGVLESAKSS
jgi:hypothetical protein